MAGGLLQLVSKGNEDMYLTYNPQITFFRNIYKRHTNFSIESVVQDFKSKPDFGKKITCTIGKQADLIHKTYVVITLPKINYSQESVELATLNKVAWIENIGWNIIKSVEIEIGGFVIDRHYGDWLFIWNELTRKKNNLNVLNKMIGNIDDLTDFSITKDSYILTIPLSFWFCNNPGLSLPIVALEFADVKFNIEFASINDVLILAPTNYIEIENNVVQFNTGDILYQQVNNIVNYIKFIDFQTIFTSGNTTVNRLYYNKINTEAIQSYSDTILKNNYKIYSLDSKYYVYPNQSALETIHINKQTNFAWVNTLSIMNAYLLVDFIYLDVDERIKFIKSNHEYLIETLLFDNDKAISNNSSKFKLGYSHPCKEFIFRARMDYLSANNVLQNSNYCVDYFKTTDIITNVQLIMNGKLRLSARESNYFSKIQVFQNHSNKPPKGIHCYSFALNPEDHQPSGTCNLSKIDDLQLSITVNNAINYSNTAKIKIYAVCLNVLRIMSGQGGLAFVN